MVEQCNVTLRCHRRRSRRRRGLCHPDVATAAASLRLSVALGVGVDGEHGRVGELGQIGGLEARIGQVSADEERRTDDGPKYQLETEAWVMRVCRQVVRAEDVEVWKARLACGGSMARSESM